MRQGESSLQAYIFVSISLLLQFLFLLSSSQSLRVVDEVRRSYLDLLNEWYVLRLATVDESSGGSVPQAVRSFDAHLESLLGSEAITASARLSPRLGQVTRRIRDSWQRAQPQIIPAGVAPGESGRVLAIALLAQVEHELTELEEPIDEMVRSQERALQTVLYVLAATILATIGIFWMIERESVHTRSEAIQIKSLAQSAIGTQEQERARIARALHDSLAQELSLLVLYLGDSEGSVSSGRREEIRDRLVRSVSWLRNLAHELHPAEIEEVGLPAALSSYCDELVTRQGAAVQCTVDESIDFLTHDQAINLYRIGQEAVTNAIRHSQATKIALSLLDLSDRIVLCVEDNGIGFKTNGLRSLGPSRGLGLVGMRERSGLIGGQIEFSSSPGEGTRIELFLPKTDRQDKRKAL